MLKAWKFIIPVGSDSIWRGHVAVAVAEDAESARSRLIAHAISKDWESDWLKEADYVEMDIDKPGVLCWAQV